MQGRWKNQSDFFRRKINIAYFYILFAKSYSLSKVYGFERDKTYKRWIAIDENIVKVYTDFITCFVFLGKIYKSDQFQGRENKNMKNMKVRTKLNLILVLVILLVALGSVVSFKDLEDVKDKALETMDASSRQSYDDSIKEQVGVVISLLSEINDAYKAGTYTLDEAKKIAADEVRQMRYGETGYFWIDQSDGTDAQIYVCNSEQHDCLGKMTGSVCLTNKVLACKGKIYPCNIKQCLRCKKYFISPRDFYSNISLPDNYTYIEPANKVVSISPHDFIVRVNTNRCTSGGHRLKDIKCSVPLVLFSGGVRRVEVPAAYCYVCDKYYILDEDYRMLKKKGVVLCHIDEKEELVKDYDYDDCDFELNKESLLHKI